jgi:toxin ParE1/3/4
MELRVHPAAREELNVALDWCQSRFGARVAAKLLHRFELAGELLMRQPDIGTPASSQARKLPLRRFPYTMVYRAEGKVVHVLALMHQNRTPDYWAKGR